MLFSPRGTAPPYIWEELAIIQLTPLQVQMGKQSSGQRRACSSVGPNGGSEDWEEPLD